MASCGTGSIEARGVPTDPEDVTMRLRGNSWTGFVAGANYLVQWGVAAVTENEQWNGYSSDTSGGWDADVGPLTADKTHKFRAKASEPATGTKLGTTKARKTSALVATAGAPSSSSITAFTATIACAYTPKTLESVASVWLEYKRTTDPTWTTAGAVDTGKQGYSPLSISRNLSSLDPLTQYQYRLQMTRDTINDTALTSASGTFTTLAAAPDVTTNAATSVGGTGATLNGTVDANGISTAVTFVWGDTLGGPYPNETSPPTTLTDDGAHAVSANISGLNYSTPYYYKCKAVAGGVTYLGAQQTFTTQADPGVIAGYQEMLPIQTFHRKYGVATTIFFHAPQVASNSSDLFYTGAAVWSAAGGEARITKVTYNDTKTPTVSGPANASNDPAQVSGPVYRLDLEAAEMQADEIFITLSNAGALGGPRDIALRVTTREQLGSVEYDAYTGQRANWTAFKALGYGSGNGITATGGATGADISGILASMAIRVGTAQAGGAAQVTLDAAASGNDDTYHEAIIMIVAGTGIGQHRLIVDYTGSSKVAIVDSAWAPNPANDSKFIIIPGPRQWLNYRGELAALPADNANYGSKMQLMFQRFAFKITQAATQQILYKADNSTPLASRSTSDAAGLQTVGKLA